MGKLVIVGGGFAGVWAAMGAAAQRANLDAPELAISLISDSANLCIRPRLYEGASPDMLVPLAPLLEEIGVELLNDRICGITGRRIQSADRSYPFDRLIVAVGSNLQSPNIPGAQQFTFNVDTYEQAVVFDRHLDALVRRQPEQRSVVVVGAGFTGIELITQLRQRLGDDVTLYLIDQDDVVGRSLGPSLTATIETALASANVEILMSTSIRRVSDACVELDSGDVIATETVVLTSGVVANRLTSGIEAGRDAAGRILVDDELRVPEHPHIFVAGDAAAATTDGVHPTLMSCQHAMPMGVTAGRNAVRDLRSVNMKPFRKPFYATCLDLGRAGGVLTHGWDRSIVETGEVGLAIKQEINTNWIYPPDPALGREQIFQTVLQDI